MGPLLVLFFPCFRDNIIVPCKIWSFWRSLDFFFLKKVIVFFFRNQILIWRSFEKRTILTYFSYFLVTREKTQKYLQHFLFIYIHVCCSPYWLFCLSNFCKNYKFIMHGFSLVWLLVLILICAILEQSINNKLVSKI